MELSNRAHNAFFWILLLAIVALYGVALLCDDIKYVSFSILALSLITTIFGTRFLFPEFSKPPQTMKLAMWGIKNITHAALFIATFVLQTCAIMGVRDLIH